MSEPDLRVERREVGAVTLPSRDMRGSRKEGKRAEEGGAWRDGRGRS